MKMILFGKEYNTNENITSKFIKTLDSNSNYLGIFKFADALKKARESFSDLIEISKKEDFSICKIIKYGKFYYLEEKKVEIKKEIKIKKTKEMKFNLFIAHKDYLIKLKHIKKFLSKGLSVKSSFLIKGRESTKMNIIEKTVTKLIEDLKDDGNLFKFPNLKERYITALFLPKKNV